MQTYRDNGAVGALLDEYEKAIDALINVLKPITPQQLTTIVDPITKDEDCRSIQTILTHVVNSGYGYAIIIRKHKGEEIAYISRQTIDDTAAYTLALRQMFAFNVKLFDDYPKLTLEEYDNDKKILVRWGQRYDVEQLIEHAIVHILRHRRQIERFLLKL